MIRLKREVVRRGFLLLAACVMLISAGSEMAAAADTASYQSAEELYSALAKLPEAQRQEAILKGAQKEGFVAIYEAANEEIMAAVIKGFEQRYPGVKVEMYRGTSDEIAVKMLTEMRAGKWFWDVANTGTGYEDLKKGKALAKHYGLVERGTPPKSALGDDWFGVFIFPHIIAYNTNLVKANEAPKSYKDLLDPKWKAKVSIDPSPDNLLGSMVKAWGKDKTSDWLDKFINVNEALIRKGRTTQVKLLAAGEYSVASEVYAYQTEQTKLERKAPVDWVVPQDIIAADIPGWAIAKRAPHPYAALLYSQYRTSLEGINAFTTFGVIPLRPDATLKYPRMKELISGPALNVRSLLNVEDTKYIEQAAELINKYINPRLRMK